MADSASVQAYDLEARVRAYDVDMEIMHPLRSKMADVVVEVLPWGPGETLSALDLGVGTGLLTRRFLGAYPQARVLALDGAAAMLDLCRARLGADAARVELCIADFRAIPAERVRPASLDVVFSSFALHHLNRREKTAVIAQCVGWLRPGGWFLNADLVVASDARIENRIQDLRVAGILARSGGDPRFAAFEATRAFLDELERNERDQPLTLDEDLALAREAGLASVEVFWREYREAVWGGPV